MKFLNLLAPLLFGSFVAADVSFSFSGGDDVNQVVEQSLEVPGKSPLQFCKETHESDILTIEQVDLSPNPPSAGATLTIEASGVFNEDIEDGAYVILQVKYGLIRLINMKVDLCDQVKEIEMECPIKKGKTVIMKQVDLPKDIPPGKYTVLADVYTVDAQPITCLTATVVFSRSGGGDPPSHPPSVDL